MINFTCYGNETLLKMPSGKIAGSADAANAFPFHAPSLSDYITGSTIDVNGGSCLHCDSSAHILVLIVRHFPYIAWISFGLVIGELDLPIHQSI